MRNSECRANLNSINKEREINIFEFKNFHDIDIWFPILHGANGEDGTIQGLLKFTQKPFVGSGILGSAIGMDKISMKFIFSHLNIPQVKYFPIQNLDPNDKNKLEHLCERITKQLDFPLFVKPSNSGSSIGISKIEDKSEIIRAIKKAWDIDNRIVIEEGLEVRELECGVIGKDDLRASEVGEVNYSSDWYDYDSKYLNENKIIIPSNINPEIKKIIQILSIETCKALNINIFARVDFFLEKSSNKIYLNEINTIPGFTKKSMFPLLWEESGLNIDQLVATLIEYSL